MLHLASQSLTYFLLFIALYFEVFLLITYFEHGESKNKKTKKQKLEILPANLPSVAIMVPCWNEEKTVSATIHSILNLDYPAEKLKIYIVDDGSTDNTWQTVQEFKDNTQVMLLRRGAEEERGKHLALNYALTFIESDLIGCLDADSFVQRDALQKIVAGFNNKEMMAVTPSIKIFEPKNVLELIQKVEYGWGVLLRNLMSKLNAVYVTPGPFSIFRKEVFDKLGGYRDGHKTEDMELAMRMQTNGYKIGNAPDAFIYTKAPKTVKTLYKQRLRWTYGFLKNAIDYKHVYFNPRYGNLGMVVFPIATLSIFSSTFLLISTVSSWVSQLSEKLLKISAVGIDLHWHPGFDWFFLDTNAISMLALVGILGSAVMLFISRKMSEGSFRPGIDMLLFMTLYAFLTPLWMVKAIYNVAFAKKTTWR